MKPVFRRLLSAGLCLLVPFAATAQQSSQLKIVVLEGENATHNIRLKAVSPTLIEVRDERNRPVPGATVKFALPEHGPGGSFAGGEHVLISRTDSSGQATLSSFVPNEEEGAFSLGVIATYSGRQGQTFVNQLNALTERTAIGAPPAPARRGGNTKKLLLFVALSGAAAAAGIIAVSSRGGTISSAPPTTAGAGTIIVGGPR